MKLRSIFCIIIVLCVCACRDTKNNDPLVGPNGGNVDEYGNSLINNALTYDELFDIDALNSVSLQITEADWNALLANFDVNEQNNIYVPATFIYQRDTAIYVLDSVGVRLRGNTSRRRPEGALGEPHNADNPDWHHAHFQVKFDEFRDKQRFASCDRIVLKWFKDDAAYCREVYSYDLFRRFGVWTAPRACYTRFSLQISDEPTAYFGVYALIEGVSKDFLKVRKDVDATRWQSAQGNLWKGNFGATLSPGTMGNENFGIGVSTLEQNLSYIYELKTNKKNGFEAARTQLQQFVADMNQLPSGSSELKAFLEQRVAVDQFLRAYAVNVMVGMWDDYWHSTNNFYFYFDVDGRFFFIPFDYDNTLGTSLEMENSGTQSMLYWGSLEGDRVLMRKVMSISEYRERYKLYIKQLASPSEDLFYTDKSIARIQKWHKMIAPYVANDTGEDMEIVDRPAWWGNCSFYRVLTGNDQGGANGEANWFRTKIKSIDF